MTDSERELLLALAAMLLALRRATGQGVDYDFYGSQIDTLRKRVASELKMSRAKSLQGMLGITAYKIPEVDNPKRNPMIGCPFLDANTPERARDVLREGMADWHEGDPQWKELIDKLLASLPPSVSDKPPGSAAPPPHDAA